MNIIELLKPALVIRYAFINNVKQLFNLSECMVSLLKYFCALFSTSQIGHSKHCVFALLLGP